PSIALSRYHARPASHLSGAPSTECPTAGVTRLRWSAPAPRSFGHGPSARRASERASVPVRRYTEIRLKEGRYVGTEGRGGAGPWDAREHVGPARSRRGVLAGGRS